VKAMREELTSMVEDMGTSVYNQMVELKDVVTSSIDRRYVHLTHKMHEEVKARVTAIVAKEKEAITKQSVTISAIDKQERCATTGAPITTTTTPSSSSSSSSSPTYTLVLTPAASSSSSGGGASDEATEKEKRYGFYLPPKYINRYYGYYKEGEEDKHGFWMTDVCGDIRWVNHSGKNMVIPQEYEKKAQKERQRLADEVLAKRRVCQQAMAEYENGKSQARKNYENAWFRSRGYPIPHPSVVAARVPSAIIDEGEEEEEKEDGR